MVHLLSYFASFCLRMCGFVGKIASSELLPVDTEVTLWALQIYSASDILIFFSVLLIIAFNPLA